MEKVLNRLDSCYWDYELEIIWKLVSCMDVLYIHKCEEPKV